MSLRCNKYGESVMNVYATHLSQLSTAKDVG